jgi:hypothetical protein
VVAVDQAFHTPWLPSFRDQKSKATILETLSKEPPELWRRKR